MSNRTKELREVIRDAESRGWQAERTGGGHIRLVHPQGGLVFCSDTPSDHRAIANTKAHIARQETAIFAGDEEALSEDVIESFDEHFNAICQYPGCGKMFASGWGLARHHELEHYVPEDANEEREWRTCPECGAEDAEVVGGELVCRCHTEQSEPEPETEEDEDMSAQEQVDLRPRHEQLYEFVRTFESVSTKQIAEYLGCSTAVASATGSDVARRHEDIVRRPRREGGGLMLRKLREVPAILEAAEPESDVQPVSAEPEGEPTDERFERFEVLERIVDGPTIVRDVEGRVWVMRRPT